MAAARSRRTRRRAALESSQETVASPSISKGMLWVGSKEVEQHGLTSQHCPLRKSHMGEQTSSDRGSESWEMAGVAGMQNEANCLRRAAKGK
jgi:hypothetical protein